MLISIAGPSGSGKGYVKKEVLDIFPEIRELVWTTTRELRPDEDQRSNRRNVHLDEFNWLRDEEMLVCCQELYGNLYGIENQQLASTNDGIHLTEVRVENLLTMRGLVTHLVPVALIPDSLDLLRHRLVVSRCTESPEEVDRRIREAEKEIQEIKRKQREFSLVIKFSESTQQQVVPTVIKFLQMTMEKYRR